MRYGDQQRRALQRRLKQKEQQEMFVNPFAGLKLQVALVSVGVVLAALVASYYVGYVKGGASCRADVKEQIQNQNQELKQNLHDAGEKVEKVFDQKEAARNENRSKLEKSVATYSAGKAVSPPVAGGNDRVCVGIDDAGVRLINSAVDSGRSPREGAGTDPLQKVETPSQR